MTPIRSLMGRRQFLIAAGATSTAALAYMAFGCTMSRQNLKDSPVVGTQYGKVSGIMASGVMAFLGIPYGASTEGKNRFMAPQKPSSWGGTRSAISFGPVAPSIDSANYLTMKPDNYHYPIQVPRQLPRSEDCLSLNIWTSSLKGPKRPVMVWLHGGAFGGGASSAPAYNGSRLAARGVILVSINHRLGSLGYTDLGAFGDQRFAEAGNAGMLDIVAALSWIRDNIAAFGGDPDRVTIFGESGGGQKVSIMLAMPAAKGLFHRAIIESGAALRIAQRPNSAESAEKFLSVLGLSSQNASEAQKLPLEQIMAAQSETGGYGPVVDGVVLPQHPFDPEAPKFSADVPIIIGYNRTENTELIARPDGGMDKFQMDIRELKKQLESKFAANTDRVIASYKKNHPDLDATGLYFRITSDTDYGLLRTIQLADLKTAQKLAPVWMYRFDWATPIMGGVVQTPHMLEIPFVFDNAAEDFCLPMTGGGSAAADLAARMSGAWVTFAKTGNPDSSGIPHWPVYEAPERFAMLFDNKCRVVKDPSGDDWRALNEFKQFSK